MIFHTLKRVFLANQIKHPDFLNQILYDF